MGAGKWPEPSLRRYSSIVGFTRKQREAIPSPGINTRSAERKLKPAHKISPDLSQDRLPAGRAEHVNMPEDNALWSTSAPTTQQTPAQTPPDEGRDVICACLCDTGAAAAGPPDGRSTRQVVTMLLGLQMALEQFPYDEQILFRKAIAAAADVAWLDVRIIPSITPRLRRLLDETIQILVEISVRSSDDAQVIAKNLSADRINLHLQRAGFPPAEVLQGGAEQDEDSNVGVIIGSLSAAAGGAFMFGIAAVYYVRKRGKRSQGTERKVKRRRKNGKGATQKKTSGDEEKNGEGKGIKKKKTRHMTGEFPQMGAIEDRTEAEEGIMEATEAKELVADEIGAKEDKDGADNQEEDESTIGSSIEREIGWSGAGSPAASGEGDECPSGGIDIGLGVENGDESATEEAFVETDADRGYDDVAAIFPEEFDAFLEMIALDGEEGVQTGRREQRFHADMNHAHARNSAVGPVAQNRMIEGATYAANEDTKYLHAGENGNEDRLNDVDVESESVESRNSLAGTMTWRQDSMYESQYDLAVGECTDPAKPGHYNANGCFSTESQADAEYMASAPSRFEFSHSQEKDERLQVERDRRFFFAGVSSAAAAMRHELERKLEESRDELERREAGQRTFRDPVVGPAEMMQGSVRLGVQLLGGDQNCKNPLEIQLLRSYVKVTMKKP